MFIFARVILGDCVWKTLCTSYWLCVTFSKEFNLSKKLSCLSCKVVTDIYYRFVYVHKRNDLNFLEILIVYCIRNTQTNQFTSYSHYFSLLNNVIDVVSVLVYNCTEEKEIWFCWYTQLFFHVKHDMCTENVISMQEIDVCLGLMRVTSTSSCFTFLF